MNDEPVAWMHKDDRDTFFSSIDHSIDSKWIPLYTHPAPLEPKIKRACKKCIEQQAEIEVLKIKLKLNDETLKPMLINYIKSNTQKNQQEVFFATYDSVRKALG